MKKILLAIVAFFPITCFAQQWNEYKVDDNLTVQIPDNFDVMDTLGQHIIRAQLENALIMIQRISNQGEQATNIKAKNELIENYTGFQKGFIESQNGKFKSQELIEENGLILSRFAFYATLGEEKQIRHCLVIFINEYWYAIQFWEVESMTEELTKDREMLFSSIKLAPGLDLKNQMSDSTEGSSGYKVGYLIGQILGYLFIGGILGALIVWILKRGKSKKAQQ